MYYIIIRITTFARFPSMTAYWCEEEQLSVYINSIYWLFPDEGKEMFYQCEQTLVWPRHADHKERLRRRLTKGVGEVINKMNNRSTGLAKIVGCVISTWLCIILAAIKDEASRKMTKEGYHVLSKIAAENIASFGNRGSFALIGFTETKKPSFVKQVCAVFQII